MARRLKRQYEIRQKRLIVWWVAIVVLAVVPWQLEATQLWILPILAWGYYELCACPTMCSIRTSRGGLCRNPTLGRLYACGSQPSHTALKNDAYLRLLGMRRSHPLLATPTRGPRAHATTHEGVREKATVQHRQTLMVFFTVIGTGAGVVQALFVAVT
jgi:hypothetical protein